MLELNNNGLSPLVIINPLEGELVNSNAILSLYQQANITFLPCIAFSLNNFIQASALANQFVNDNLAFATYFKDEPLQNVSAITSRALVNSVFTTQNTSSLFLSSIPRLVKLQDCFSAQSRNANYSPVPYIYTDAHLTYTSLPNAIGFGDYQIVGEPFNENGGPARAVAIHITYINSQYNDYMFIKHCVSTLNSGTTTDTANKCMQALGDLMTFANQTSDIDQSTIGFSGLRDYHTRRHYPNLGPIKECSIMHHIETYNNYL